MKQPLIVTLCCCCCAKSLERRQRERDLEKLETQAKLDGQGHPSPSPSSGNHNHNNDASLAQIAIDTGLRNRSPSRSLERTDRQSPETRQHHQPQQHLQPDSSPPDQHQPPPPSYDTVLKDNDRTLHGPGVEYACAPVEPEGSKSIPVELLHTPVNATSSTTPASTANSALLSPVGTSTMAPQATPATARPRGSMEKESH